jgi:hypothetical protein
VSNYLSKEKTKLDIYQVFHMLYGGDHNRGNGLTTELICGAQTAQLLKGIRNIVALHLHHGVFML